MSEIDDDASRAEKADYLSKRIRANQAGQSLDFNGWIFEGLPSVLSGPVLDLCCGTGSQSIRFLRRAEEGGHVYATDISAEALDKLQERAASAGLSDALTTIEADMDALDKPGDVDGFQTVFCCYGLYYSDDVVALLQKAKQWLQPGGELAVVGPFGPNNREIFDLLGSAGVEIDEDILFSCGGFMPEVAVAWMAENFAEVDVRTAANPVSWTSSQHVLDYWRNSTFFDPERDEKVEKLVDEHFEQHDVFVNTKWIMMATAARAR